MFWRYSGKQERWVAAEKFEEKAELYRVKLQSYRKANPDKVKKWTVSDAARNRTKILARKKRYREANGAKISAFRKAYYLENGERERSAHGDWKQRNAGQIEKYEAEYRNKNRAILAEKAKKFYYAFPDKIMATRKKGANRARAYQRRRHALFPEKTKARCARHRARKLSLASPDANQKLITAIYATAKRISRCTGISFHVDHIKPLARGGLHHEKNLQILPGMINQRKGAKWAPR